MINCIFCKIIKGEIPSFVVYEDEIFKVIMDRFPASKGHLLILSKTHHENIFDMPQSVAEKIYPLAQKLSGVLKEALDVEAVNVMQNNGEIAGQAVHHSHVHLIPRSKDDGVKLNQTSNQDTTLEELEEVAKKIRAVIEAKML